MLISVRTELDFIPEFIISFRKSLELMKIRGIGFDVFNE